MLNILVRISAAAIIVLPTLIVNPTTKIEGVTSSSPSESNFQTQKQKPLIFEANVTAKKDDRAQILGKFLEQRNSPMAKDAKKLVQIADKYDLDWKLLPAIAGVESQYGHMIPSGSYNPYGWNNGASYFTNWADASETVASGIRSRYAQSGAVTPYIIGPKYAANPLWASQVSNYMYQIDQI